MKQWRWVVVLTLVIALAAALPAIGAPSPSRVASKAMRLAKQADSRSRKALRLAKQRGPQGPAGAAGLPGAAGVAGSNGTNGQAGATGPAGTARAYAQVDAVADDYVSARTKGFTGLDRPAGPGGIGIYCLTIDPALGIDPLTVAAVASPEAGNSSDHGGAAEVKGDGSASCSAGQFAVLTYNSAGVISDAVSFNILVP